MEALRAVLAIGFVFALLAASLWVVRAAARSGRWLSAVPASASRRRSLRSLERLSLSPGCTLHLLELDDKRLLVAVTKEGARLLTGGAPHIAAPSSENLASL